MIANLVLLIADTVLLTYLILLLKNPKATKKPLKKTEHLEHTYPTAIDLEPLKPSMLNTEEGAKKEKEQIETEEEKKKREELDKIMEDNMKQYNTAFTNTLKEIMDGGGNE